MNETLMATNELGEGDYERLYRSLRLIRRAEEEVARIYPSDKIKSPVHLSIGQEAVSVGVCDVLRLEDAVAPTYRGHAAYLAKGGSLRGLMAEMYGKATGVAGVCGLFHVDRFRTRFSSKFGEGLRPSRIRYEDLMSRCGETTR